MQQFSLCVCNCEISAISFSLPSLFCPLLSVWTYSVLPKLQERSHIHQGAGRNTLRTKRKTENTGRKGFIQMPSGIWSQRSKCQKAFECFSESEVTVQRQLTTEFIRVHIAVKRRQNRKI